MAKTSSNFGSQGTGVEPSEIESEKEIKDHLYSICKTFSFFVLFYFLIRLIYFIKASWGIFPSCLAIWKSLLALSKDHAALARHLQRKIQINQYLRKTIFIITKAYISENVGFIWVSSLKVKTALDLSACCLEGLVIVSWSFIMQSPSPCGTTINTRLKNRMM